MSTMIRRRLLSSSLAAALTFAALVSPGSLRLARAAEVAKEWDGLELRSSKRVDRLYVRPGATLEGYKHVRLERLEVHFAKNWDPNRGRSGAERLTGEDFARIKEALADAFAAECTKELAKGGYDVVTASGEDVLDVTPVVVDLFIAAPTVPVAGRTTSYTADPGRMALIAELRDSETGQSIARVIDRRNLPSTGNFQITTSVSNLGSARQVIARWASALRAALDAANGKGN
ncbi:MAG TPA: DUF3313 family protein [Steroidobacteraceae bacterium]|nr:DUF3313 family protein [Steroidobacteraceae bacterium]